MNAQTWLLNHYWLFLLEDFFSSQGGLGPKGCVGHMPMIKEDISLDIMNDLCFDTYANLDFVFVL